MQTFKSFELTRLLETDGDQDWHFHGRNDVLDKVVRIFSFATVFMLAHTITDTQCMWRRLVKLMEPMIDPNYKQKKEAEKLRKSLMQRLGATIKRTCTSASLTSSSRASDSAALASACSFYPQCSFWSESHQHKCQNTFPPICANVSGRDDIETSDYEDIIAKEAVNPADIDCTFEDIGGLDEEKKRLRELVVLTKCLYMCVSCLCLGLRLRLRLRWWLHT